MERPDRLRFYVKVLFRDCGVTTLKRFDSYDDALGYKQSLEGRVVYEDRTYKLDIVQERMVLEDVVNVRKTRRSGN